MSGGIGAIGANGSLNGTNGCSIGANGDDVGGANGGPNRPWLCSIGTNIMEPMEPLKDWSMVGFDIWVPTSAVGYLKSSVS